MRLGSISACAGIVLGHLVLGHPAQAQTPPAPAAAPPAVADGRTDPQALVQQSVGEMQRAQAAGNLPEMLRIAERVYERLRTDAGPEHPMTAVALANLGAAQRHTGAVDEAAGTLQRALALESKLGSPARDTFRCVLRDLSDLERGRGRAQAAISIYDAVIERLRKEGTGTIAEADLLEEQAQLMRHAGAFAPAGERLEAALAIKQAKLPPSDMGLVSTLTHLAGIARLTGRPADAEAYYKRGIAIVTAGKGVKDPNLGILVDNLGVLYQSIGRDADAEAQHKRALAIFEETLGREHVSTAQCVANLAAVNFKQGRFADAEPLFARAPAIYRAKLAPGDWRIGVTLDNLAGVWRSQGRYQEAAGGYEQALAILRKAYSDTHPDVGTALNNLAVMYSETGKLAEAEKAASEALAIVEKAQGAGHIDVAYVLNTRGSVLADQGRLADARRDYERSVSIIEKSVGGDHPLLVTPLSALGELQLAGGDPAGAISLFQRAGSIEGKGRARDARRVQRATNATPTPFVGLVAALWQLEQQDKPAQTEAKGSAKPPSRADDALFQAQWALESEAGRAVAQLGARLGTRNPALAALARERQDLTEE